MDPLVSVNITTFNRADYLPRALQSVLAQDYPAFEVIVVDDASTDHTPEVMREREEDPRVRYVRHPENRGLSTTRNTAFAHSRGDFIAWLDDDDEWVDLAKLRKQVAFLTEDRMNSCAVVGTSFILVDGEGREETRRIDLPSDLGKWLLSRNGLLYPTTAMARRDALERFGGFDPLMRRGVDSDFYRHVVIRQKRQIACLPDVTARIYEHPGARITTGHPRTVHRTVVSAQSRVVRKYLDAFVRHPVALLYRLRVIARHLWLGWIARPTR